MTSVLPPIPRFIFTIFEPLSLFVGFAGAIADPEWFMTEQIALSPQQTFSPNAIVVTLQLGNIYLLLAMLGVAVLYTTTEPRVVRAYVTALALGDIGHLAVTFYILEYERFLAISQWNALAWGNIAATVSLFVCRIAYLLGLFGPDQTWVVESEKLKAK